MSDIKLFRVAGDATTELVGRSMAIERQLQQLFEKNLEPLLGVRFLASEFPTGRAHGGRIDTLGIDENNSPVIIEFKRATNENVINQGLFYLDWLLDHRGDFAVLATKQLGPGIAEKIDWSSPRLLCIAGNYGKYDLYAVQQITRNIQLLRYRFYDDGFLVLELVNSATSGDDLTDETVVGGEPRARAGQTYKSVGQFLSGAPTSLQDMYHLLEDYLLALGDDVTMKETKLYFAFRRIKNFACVEVRPQSLELLVYLKVDPTGLPLTEGFTRDVTNIGHFGTGDLEVRIGSTDDLERAKAFIQMSYENS